MIGDQYSQSILRRQKLWPADAFFLCGSIPGDAGDAGLRAEGGGIVNPLGRRDSGRMDDAKRERLAAALRENLRRRKAGQRGVSDASAPVETAPPPDDQRH